MQAEVVERGVVLDSHGRLFVDGQQASQGPIRVALTDLDHTVWDPQGSHKETFIEVYLSELQASNVTPDSGVRPEDEAKLREHVASVVALSLAEQDTHNELLRWLGDFGLPLSNISADELILKRASLLVQAARSGRVKLHDPVSKMLESLDGHGCRVIGVTGSHRLFAEAMQRYYKLPYFWSLVCSDDYKNGKPHAEPFLRGLHSALDFTPGFKTLDQVRGETIALGDSRGDVFSARGAGIKLILLCPGVQDLDDYIQKLKTAPEASTANGTPARVLVLPSWDFLSIE